MKNICLFILTLALSLCLCACADNGGKNVVKEELIYDAFPLEYCLNENVDVTKISVKITYDDETTEIVPLDRRYVSGLDNVTSTLGIKTLTVKYKDISDEIDIGQRPERIGIQRVHGRISFVLSRRQTHEFQSGEYVVGTQLGTCRKYRLGALAGDPRLRVVCRKRRFRRYLVGSVRRGCR